MATKKQVILQAEPRTVLGKKVRALRRQGILPARIYGHGDPLPVQVDMRTFERMRETHQTTGVITLTIAGQGSGETVLVRHIEHQPKTGKMLHIDFARVRMDEPIRARVPLHVSGTSPAAKDIGGALLTLVESIEIECLPADLPDALIVDATKLTSPDAILHLKDIELPPGVKVLDDPEEPVAKIEPPRGAETAPAPEEPAAAEPAPQTPSTP